MKHPSGIAGAFRSVITDLRPTDPNFERVTFSGGQENRLGELVGQDVERVELYAVVTPHGVELTERGSSFDDDSLVDLYFDERALDENDRVERLEDGKPYRVTKSKTFEFGGELVGVRYTAEEVTD